MSKILVIDDDLGILEAFEVMLESFGYEVNTSATGDGGMKLVQKIKPDLILLDVLLSGQDGRDICRKLKSKDDTKQIPIIMVSAHPSADRSIKEAGADDYLAKPFEMNDLLSRIKKHLKAVD